jgi:ATP-binding cassette subfamily B protein
MAAWRARRRLLVPEVVQTSAMDCGPAALTALLKGHGIDVNYGRLREACQTDVDGTSIDTLEEVAVQLGLEAEQIMVPVDYLLLDEARALPALLVVRLPDGLTHFIIAWRRHGDLVQCMDPAQGRRWLTRRQLLDEVYVHTMPVPAADWRDWAGSDEFLGPLRRRLAWLGLATTEISQALTAALAHTGWRPIAALDAAARIVGATVRAGGLRRGHEAAGALATLLKRAASDPNDDSIPTPFWSVRPAPPDETGQEQLQLRGAVLMRILGLRGPAQPNITEDDTPTPVSPNLVAALHEVSVRPGQALLQLLHQDGLLAPIALLGAGLLAAAGVVAEGLLLRGLLDLGAGLDLAWQRIGALVALLGFMAVLLLFDLSIATGALRLARKLEVRLRMAFLRKIPRLGDHYFRSRPISDMAERSHSVHRLRLLVDLGRQVILLSIELLLTAAAIAWLYPAGGPIAVAAAILLLVLPLAAQPVLWERDLRVRTHVGALARFYLDALLGLVAVRAHRAERVVRREHEALLVDWARAGFQRRNAMTVVEGLLAYIGYGCTAWLLFDYLARAHELGGALLLTYWALKLPLLGEQIVQLALQYPGHRTALLRLLEPLGAPEEGPATIYEKQAGKHEAPSTIAGGGVAITMEEVEVLAGGHTILAEINLAVEPGSHIAIVGPSGAGKSSLVGLLLGWHRPSSGCLHIDGAPLDGPGLAQLRRTTAWVDPAVQLWNRSLLENLLYGAPPEAVRSVGTVSEQTGLRGVIEQLPAGLRTPLGEGGGLVSGGEGQRARLGRAMLRPDARLAILDEPFRGLDREQRRELLELARRRWLGATLLCITHDLHETLAFERVLVLEDGRIVEDGAPSELAARPNGRYRAMLDAEIAVREELWAGRAWRRLRLDGRLIELSQDGDAGEAEIDS